MIKQIGWLSIIPQLVLIAFIIFFLSLLKISHPFLYGAIIYLLLSYTLRNSIPYSHRKGISLTKRKKFQKAIPYFEKSYNFFNKYSWIDKYRYIILLSSSRISYKEMALINIAFSYSQINEGKKAILYYERTLKEFPDSEIARTSLNMITSLNNEK